MTTTILVLVTIVSGMVAGVIGAILVRFVMEGLSK